MEQFPNEIAVAYAICNANNNCNNKEFIVDGQTQICNKCGELLFRDEVRNYTLKEPLRKLYFENGIEFPDSIDIVYAICTNDKCSYGEFAVLKDVVKCQYCGHPMNLHGKKKYFLSYQTFICPICGYDRLFFEPYDKNGKGSYDICPNCQFLFFDYKMDDVDKNKKIYLQKNQK